MAVILCYEIAVEILMLMGDLLYSRFVPHVCF